MNTANINSYVPVSMFDAIVCSHSKSHRATPWARILKSCRRICVLICLYAFADRVLLAVKCSANDLCSSALKIKVKLK